MNQKEIAELRRHWKPERTAVSHICGCYVGSDRQIVSELDEALGGLPAEESERYLGLMKKALSGKPGKNLIDIVFSPEQVMASEEHRLLMALRDSRLKDRALRQAFYDRVIQSMDPGDSGYLLLLACDAYDVPRRGKDGETQEDASEEVFTYLVCAICPIKEGKVALGYFPGENEFHCAGGRTVAPTELGFLFPAFDDRHANIYNALFYTRKADELHADFLNAVFHTEPPFSAAEQREGFQAALAEALGENGTVELLQSIYGALLDRVETHRESRDPDALTLSQGDLASLLRSCGVSEEASGLFRRSCETRFGKGAVLQAENLLGGGKTEIRAGEITVTIPQDCGTLLKTGMVDGRRYLLLPADGALSLNGMDAR